MILIDAYTKLAGFSCEYFVPTLGRETMTNFVYNPAQHRGYQTVHSRKLHRTHIITKFGPKLHMYESQIKSGKAEAYAYMDRTYIRQWESDMRTESILKDVDR